MTVNLGDKVRDPITGFEGTVTARTEWLHGCVRVCVERGGEGGKPEDVWLDEVRVDVVEAVPADAGAGSFVTGGGSAPKSRDPAR